MTRRNFLGSVAGASVAGGGCTGAVPGGSRVAIAPSKTYDAAELMPALEKAFDQLGGLGRWVKGKTVAIKINLNGAPNRRLGHLPLEETHWPHPRLLGAAMHLMGRAGARRIRILESQWAPASAPLQETFLEACWDWQLLMGAASRVEFENTNFVGDAGKYLRFPVPGGGMLYPAYELNHSYADCDVFVSYTKPKDHSTTGITLGMKNIFGTTPLAVYGNRAGEKDENPELPTNGRLSILHYGDRQPPNIALPEIDPSSSRDDGYRIPRAIVDLCGARPVHLTLIDAVMSMAGGQGPGLMCEQVKPGVIVAGTNVVSTDAVMARLMNYDPMNDRGATPFTICDNTMALAEKAGLGTRDLSRIEVTGAAIKDHVCDYLALRRKREALRPPRPGRIEWRRGRKQS